MAEAETKEAHTPGKWEVQLSKTGIAVYPADRRRWRSKITTVPVWEGTPARAEAEANARLIAASPDLLAFAKALDASWLETFPEGPDADYSNSILNIADEHKALWRQCRAAIQRAEA